MGQCEIQLRPYNCTTVFGIKLMHSRIHPSIHPPTHTYIHLFTNSYYTTFWLHMCPIFLVQWPLELESALWRYNCEHISKPRNIFVLLENWDASFRSASPGIVTVTAHNGLKAHHTPFSRVSSLPSASEPLQNWCQDFLRFPLGLLGAHSRCSQKVTHFRARRLPKEAFWEVSSPSLLKVTLSLPHFLGSQENAVVQACPCFCAQKAEQNPGPRRLGHSPGRTPSCPFHFHLWTLKYLENIFFYYHIILNLKVKNKPLLPHIQTQPQLSFWWIYSGSPLLVRSLHSLVTLIYPQSCVLLVSQAPLHVAALFSPSSSQYVTQY